MARLQLVFRKMTYFATIQEGRNVIYMSIKEDHHWDGHRKTNFNHFCNHNHFWMKRVLVIRSFSQSFIEIY